MRRYLPYVGVTILMLLALLGTMDLFVIALPWAKEWTGIRKSSLNTLYRAGLPHTYSPRGYSGQDSGPWPLLMASSPAYANEDWAEEYWARELSHYAQIRYEAGDQFQPNVIWRVKPRQSKYVNVDADGVRTTFNQPTSSPPRQVYLFGASTAFGTGVPDEFTIASQLSRELNSVRSEFAVKNFGTGSYILQQDTQLFIEAILKREKPSVAVFYHGANDSYAALFSPAKLGWYLGSDQIERKLSRPSNAKRTSLFEDLPIVKLLLSQLIDSPLRSQEESPFLEDYTSRAQQFVAFYIETLSLLDKICHTYDVRCFYFWQPVVFYSKKPLSPFEKAMLDNPSLLSIGTFDEKHGNYQRKSMSAAYAAIEKALPPNSTFHNLNYIFDSRSETIFTDYVHVGALGNSLIAKEIAGSILANY